MNTTGSATGSGSLTINSSGTLGGTGIIQGTVINGGAIDPGAGSSSPGTLHLGGTYTQNTGGKLQIDIASLASHDELAISGSVALSGTLAVSLLDSFVPQPGSLFDIITAPSIGGSKFTSINLPSLPSGLSWNVNYSTNAVTLLVTGPGDFDRNVSVDAADYVVWRKWLGTTYTPSDYDVWRAHFGQTAGSGAGASVNAAVPEPSTLLLMVLAAAGTRLRRRRAV